MSEDADSKPGVENTTTTKTVKVTVTDDGKGHLTATATDDSPAAIDAVDFENTYSAKGEGEIKVKKTFTGREWKTADKFEFELSAVDGTPLPKKTKIEIGKPAEDADSQTENTESFGKITFTKAGEYTYTVKETTTSGKGITCETRTHTVTIKVKDNGEGELIADGTPLIQTEEFTNTYSAKGDLELKGAKTIKNKPDSMDLSGFKFTVKEGDKTVASGTSDADGKITFTKINYTSAGEHTYVVSEDADSKPGVTNTTTTKTVMVKVTDDGEGHLIATATDDSPAAIDAVDFENTYDAEGKITLKGTKKFENGDFGDATFTFSVYKKEDFQDASSELFGLKKVDRNKLAGDEELQKNKVASAKTEGLTPDDTGKVSFTFTPEIEFKLSDIINDPQTDGWYTYEYVVVEDIPETAVRKTVGEETFYYDSEKDIKYDATVYDVTIKVRDKGDGTLEVKSLVKDKDGNEVEKTEFGFENEKIYTKLKLTKVLDSLVARDTEGELTNITFVFKVSYTDPIIGKTVGRTVSVQFDPNTVTAPAVEVDKIPIKSEVKVTEVYAADYKCDGDPNKDAVLSEETDPDTGMKIFTVSFDNKRQGNITGSGVINTVDKNTFSIRSRQDSTGNNPTPETPR